ncbi:MAG: DUF692 domain-containing protein [Gammaproteobacteria bacterium]
MHNFPYLGYGLGLRPVHYPAILQAPPAIDWFEIITEDYLEMSGRPWHYLTKIRENYPLVMHGVSLSIGGTDPLDMVYLQQVKALADHIEAAWVSDHLCWTGVNGLNMHDLLPLPYTEESLQHVASRIHQAQEILGRPLVLENASTYVMYKHSPIPEWEFLTQMTKATDCYLLLDINNVYVNSFNHTFNPLDYLKGVPVERVKQFHLAGHKKFRTHIIDTHDEPIIKKVWDLYTEALKRFGKISTLIERDDNIPPLPELMLELEHARRLGEQVLSLPQSLHDFAITTQKSC